MMQFISLKKYQLKLYVYNAYKAFHFTKIIYDILNRYVQYRITLIM